VVLLASGQADALSSCYLGVGDDVADMVRRAEEIRRDELYTLRLRNALAVGAQCCWIELFHEEPMPGDLAKFHTARMLMLRNCV
jgi:hypothetical protein